MGGPPNQGNAPQMYAGMAGEGNPSRSKPTANYGGASKKDVEEILGQVEETFVFMTGVNIPGMLDTLHYDCN